MTSRLYTEETVSNKRRKTASSVTFIEKQLLFGTNVIVNAYVAQAVNSKITAILKFFVSVDKITKFVYKANL